jgi:hypothetical protein
MIITVPPGASLWSLAQQYLGDGRKWPAIYAANPQLAPNPSLIITGQRIVIPVPQGARARSRAQQDLNLAIAAAGVLIGLVTVAEATALLAAVFLRAGIGRAALEAALGVVMSFPPDRSGAPGPATLNMIRQNELRRAQFLVACSRRLEDSIREGDARGLDPEAVLNAAVARERRYLAQHAEAIWGRTMAGARVDSAASLYGPLLGWNTVLDSHTSAECKAADGKNFQADRVPVIGYPGAVHPHCRCYPGPPHPGAVLLPSEKRVVLAA